LIDIVQPIDLKGNAISMRMPSTSGSRTNALLAGVVLICAMAAWALAEPETHDRPGPAVVLSQQVWALQTLHDLDLDVAQLESVRGAIPKPEDDPVPRARNKVPAKYLATLEALRQALIRDDGSDEAKDQIDELRDDLESIQEDEQVELDDHVTITDAARAKVPDVMKALRPSQLSAYLAAYQDEVPDPVQTLVRAVDESRGADDAKFNSLSERTARDVGILLAGLDKEKAATVAERVRHWIEHARGLGDEGPKAAGNELEKDAKAVLGEFDSFDVLRHWVERDVAELLSNPQLGVMIDERIKHAGK
jgi:hypothetical protein